MPTLLLAGLHHPAVSLAVFVIRLAALLPPCANIKMLARTLVPMPLVAVGMFSIGYHFHVGASMPINTAAQALTGTTVWNGLVLGSRVLALVRLGLLFILTTDRVLLVHSLQQQLRLLPVFAYGLLVVWGIPPNTMEEYKRIRAAFVARGIRVLPVFPVLFKLLPVKPVHWPEGLSIAVESRDFDGRALRMCSQPPCLWPVDVPFLILSRALLLAPLFLLRR